MFSKIYILAAICFSVIRADFVGGHVFNSTAMEEMMSGWEAQYDTVNQLSEQMVNNTNSSVTDVWAKYQGQFQEAFQRYNELNARAIDLGNRFAGDVNATLKVLQWADINPLATVGKLFEMFPELQDRIMEANITQNVTESAKQWMLSNPEVADIVGDLIEDQELEIDLDDIFSFDDLVSTRQEEFCDGYGCYECNADRNGNINYQQCFQSNDIPYYYTEEYNTTVLCMSVYPWECYPQEAPGPDFADFLNNTISQNVTFSFEGFSFQWIGPSMTSMASWKNNTKAEFTILQANLLNDTANFLDGYAFAVNQLANTMKENHIARIPQKYDAMEATLDFIAQNVTVNGEPLEDMFTFWPNVTYNDYYNMSTTWFNDTIVIPMVNSAMDVYYNAEWKEYDAAEMKMNAQDSLSLNSNDQVVVEDSSMTTWQYGLICFGTLSAVTIVTKAIYKRRRENKFVQA